MKIVAEPCDILPDDLDAVVRRRLANAEVAIAPGAVLSIVGPFRSFTADDDDFAAGRTRRAIRPTGWRGLLLADRRPVAIVELSQRDARVRVALRPGDPAVAMHATLGFISDVADPGGGPHRLRWLTMPGVFLTSFLIEGKRRLFVPTRVGSGPRPSPEMLDRAAFLGLVRARRRRDKAREARMPPVSDARDGRSYDTRGLPRSGKP